MQTPATLLVCGYLRVGTLFQLVHVCFSLRVLVTLRVSGWMDGWMVTQRRNAHLVSLLPTQEEIIVQ